MRKKHTDPDQAHVCRLCGQEIGPAPTITSTELRAIRAGLGWRLGYRELGKGLLPRSLFAWLLGISDRTCGNYLAGVRDHDKRVRIPSRVAVRARQLAEMNMDDLRAVIPERSELRRMSRLKRKRLWAARRLQRGNELEDVDTGPEPPF